MKRSTTAAKASFTSNKPISEIIPGDSIYYIQTDKGPLQIEKNRDYTFV